MRKSSIILILALALGIPIVLGTCAYNDMVSAEQQVDAGWAQVENVLQRRADLIPNLVATVKGIAAQEQAVFTAVADARGRLLAARGPADAGEADAALDSALGRLLAISERYPELRSSENFIRLQDELAGTENRIAVERRRYNDLVRDYNVSIKRFPRRIFAALFGFEEREFFRAAEGAQEVPRVDFGAGQ
ncbi:MAG TPA: LemA family protein [Haliangium sp.]|nr:LemA family protein [Haliangium sp.]